MSFARFLNGALKYRNEIKPTMVKQLAEINKNPKVSFLLEEHEHFLSPFTVSIQKFISFGV